MWHAPGPRLDMAASRADDGMRAVATPTALVEMRALARAAVASAVLVALPTRAAAVRAPARGTPEVALTLEAAVPDDAMPPPAAQRTAIVAHDDPLSGCAGAGAGPRSSGRSWR